MTTNTLKHIIMLSMTAIILSFPANAQSMRWKLKSIETRWKESRLTGAKFDVKTKEKATVVMVNVSKVKVEENYYLSFERSKMRHESDTNYDAFLGKISFDSKNELISSLLNVKNRMNKVSSEDIEDIVFSEGDIEVVYFAKSGYSQLYKQHLEISFDDTTFILQKNEVEELISKLKSIK